MGAGTRNCRMVWLTAFMAVSAQALDVAASHLKLADVLSAAGRMDLATTHAADARGLLAALAALATPPPAGQEGGGAAGELDPMLAMRLVQLSTALQRLELPGAAESTEC